MRLTLKDLGWDKSCFDHKIDSQNGHFIGRISAVYKDIYSILTPTGEIRAYLPGKFYQYRDDELPVVGDWVISHPVEDGDKALIEDLIPRKNHLSRKVSGKKVAEQVMASNIDYGFIVQGLDHNFNINRVERYITMIRRSGITPVILLNKCDLYRDHDSILLEVREATQIRDVHLISCKQGFGMNTVKTYLQIGVTACFLGSSGVGKSSIINYLAGSDRQQVNEVRRTDSRGRHTTTTRQLFLLPEGGLVIDTPGMRELQIWGSTPEIDDSFDDIKELALLCQYRNCTHDTEPNCNIKRAIKKGQLKIERLRNYQKIIRETKYMESLQSKDLRLVRRKSRKDFSKEIRKMYKTRKKKI